MVLYMQNTVNIISFNELPPHLEFKKEGSLVIYKGKAVQVMTAKEVWGPIKRVLIAIAQIFLFAVTLSLICLSERYRAYGSAFITGYRKITCYVDNATFPPEDPKSEVQKIMDEMVLKVENGLNQTVNSEPTQVQAVPLTTKPELEEVFELPKVTKPADYLSKGTILHEETINFVADAIKIIEEKALKANMESEKIKKLIEWSTYVLFDIHEIFLQYPPEDRETAMEAVKINGKAIRDVSKSLNDDLELFQEAIKTYPEAIMLASDRIKDNDAFVNTVISKKPWLLCYASHRIKKEKNVPLKEPAFVINLRAYMKGIRPHLCSNKDFILKWNFPFLKLAMQNLNETLQKDQDFVIKYHRNTAVRYLHESLLRDKDFLLQFFKEANGFYSDLISVLPPDIFEDLNFMNSLIDIDPYIYNYKIPDSVKKDVNIAIKALAKKVELPDDLPKELFDNLEFIRQRMAINPKVFSKASPEIRNDYALAMQAIEKDPTLIKDVSSDLKDNEKFMLEVAVKDILCIKEASNTLRSNKAFMDKAIKIHRMALIYATGPLTEDVEWIIKNITDFNNEFSIRIKNANRVVDQENKVFAWSGPIIGAYRGYVEDYISPKIRNDEALVWRFLKNSGLYEFGLRILPLSELKMDKKFLLQVYQDSTVKYYLKCPKEHLDDIPFIKKLLQLKVPFSLKDASPQVRETRDLVLADLSLAGKEYEHIPDIFKKDRDMAIAAITNNWEAYKFLTDEFKMDLEMVRLALIKSAGFAYEFVPVDLKIKNPDLVEVDKVNGPFVRWIPIELLKDREFVKRIVTQRFSCFSNLPLELKYREDEEIVQLVLEKYPSETRFISPKLHTREFLSKVVEKNKKILYYKS